MTPTIVITLDGGVVQDISVSHQVNVIVLDRDTDGVDLDDLTMIDGCAAWASVHGSPCMPCLGQTGFITRVLEDILADVRPNE